jgi:hypothetical protein
LNGPVKRTGNLLYIGSKDSEQLVVNTTALSEEIMKGASEQEKSKFKNINGIPLFFTPF